MAGRDVSMGSTGFGHMTITIQEITTSGSPSDSLDGTDVIVSEPGAVYAYGTDNFGRNIQVPMNIQRAKGSYPLVGETWIIEKDLGVWTFAAIVGTWDNPVVKVHAGTNISVNNSDPTNPIISATGGSGVEDITSPNASLLVTNGTGPTAHVELNNPTGIDNGSGVTFSLDVDSGDAPDFAFLDINNHGLDIYLQSWNGPNPYTLLSFNDRSGAGYFGETALMMGPTSPHGRVSTNGSYTFYLDSQDSSIWMNQDPGGGINNWVQVYNQMMNSTHGVTLSDNSTTGIVIQESNTGGIIQILGPGTASSGVAGVQLSHTSAAMTFTSGSVGAGQVIANGSGVTLGPNTHIAGNAHIVSGGPTGGLSFFGATGAVRQTVTGSRGGNLALQNLLLALADYGIIADSTTP